MAREKVGVRYSYQHKIGCPHSEEGRTSVTLGCRFRCEQGRRCSDRLCRFPVGREEHTADQADGDVLGGGNALTHAVPSHAPSHVPTRPAPRMMPPN